MRLSVAGLETGYVEAIRGGGGDANGEPAWVRVAEGVANPCRHCLGLIAAGDEKLVLAHRPFPGPQPYAEVGPIFLHRSSCPRYVSDRVPGWFAFLEPALVRGYDHEDWIRYETGRVVRGIDVEAEARGILEDDAVAYVHVRSKFNCFQCRIDRG